MILEGSLEIENRTRMSRILLINTGFLNLSASIPTIRVIRVQKKD